MNLFYIRHLPTKWNKEGRLQGTRNIPIAPLTPSLELKISANKRELSNINFDLILTSSLDRTIQTSEAYGYDKVRIEPLLNELDFGKFEGILKRDMIMAVGYLWKECPRHMDFGETFDSFEKRIENFLQKYSPFQNILIFGHGAVLRAIYSLIYTGIIDNMNTFDFENNSLTIIKK